MKATIAILLTLIILVQSSIGLAKVNVEVDCLVVPTLRKPTARKDGILFKREDAATIGLYFKHCTPRQLSQIKVLEEKVMVLRDQDDTSQKIIHNQKGIIEDKDKEIELLEASEQPLWEKVLIYTGVGIIGLGAGTALGAYLLRGRL